MWHAWEGFKKRSKGLGAVIEITKIGVKQWKYLQQVTTSWFTTRFHLLLQQWQSRLFTTWSHEVEFLLHIAVPSQCRQ
jgi:hypothetical protein